MKFEISGPVEKGFEKIVALGAEPARLIQSAIMNELFARYDGAAVNLDDEYEEYMATFDASDPVTWGVRVIDENE